MSIERESVGLLEDERRGRRAQEAKAPAGGGAGRRAWKGTLRDRIRVARKLPQAVLKISSHNTGESRVRARLHYISRRGALSVETDEGITLDGLEEIDRLVDDWAADFSRRANSRDAMSVVVSVPVGTDEKAALSAARAFFKETFAENHEYAFAGHDDTDHYHIHLVVKARGRDGKPMRPTRRDPQQWRQAFAEQARAHGVALDASPRTARGKGRRTPPTPIVEMRRRDELPRVDQAAADRAVQRAMNPKDRSSQSERVIRQINKQERLAFAKQALVVLNEAKTLKDDQQRLGALEIASELASFAEGMPVPRSRLETMKLALKPDINLPKVELSEVRRVVKLAERGIRDQVSSFASGSDRRRAIAARSRLSAAIGGSSQHRARDRDIDR